MAEEEKLRSQLKNITSSLQKIAECPVCLDTIKIPFKTCGTGHGVCSSCCDRLEKCPTCEDPFTKENPICLKNLLEALPRDCRYSDAGCEEVVEQGSDHQRFCGYRPTACRFPYCKVTVPLIKLMDHLKTDHPNYFIEKNSQGMRLRQFHAKKFQSCHTPVSLFGNIFWLSAYNDFQEKCLKFTFQATPVGKLENNYFARVKFEKDDFVYTSTIKASVSSSCEIEEHNKKVDDDEQDLQSDDDDDEDDLASDDGQYRMTVPHSALHNFIYLDDNLQYNVVVFEKEK